MLSRVAARPHTPTMQNHRHRPNQDREHELPGRPNPAQDNERVLWAADCRLKTSSRKKNRMISLAGCIINASHNIFPLKRGVVFQNFLNARTSARQLQNVGHPNPHPPNTRTPATLCVVDCDALLKWFHQVQPTPNTLHPPLRSTISSLPNSMRKN